MNLTDLIEKAAALAGKLGKKDLQEKLLQLAKEAETYQKGFAEEWKKYDEPSAPSPKMNGQETRKAISSVLREALDPAQRSESYGAEDYLAKNR